MKKNGVFLLAFVFAITIMASCAQEKNSENKSVDKTSVLLKEDSIAMNRDSLDKKVIADLDQKIIDQKANLVKETLSTIGETQSLLEDVKKGKKDDAIKKGELLIGKLEVLLARDPSLKLIPIDVNYQKEEFITDIETVRATTKLAQKAMDDGYFQQASDLLKDMRSEIIINTYLLPITTYPEAIKVAVALLKEDKNKEAEIALTNVLGTIVIEKTILPLPILNAEQMIIKAASIDSENHENVSKVINLLKNAEYQLTLAEEMGYGKKHKDYKILAESIKALKKSVKKKENSKSKFDVIKEDFIKFKENLFSSNKSK